MTVKERVEALRNLMKQKGMDAYIVPSFDAHQSEYVANHWKSREWISGFTGSAGTAVITHGQNGVWTDGRYFIQAARQLEGSGIDLFKMGQPNVPTYEQWLCDTLPEGAVVGFDGRVFSVAVVRIMEKKFAKKNIKIISDYDLIGEIWNERPEIPKEAIISHAVEFAGKSRVDKINEVRKHMEKLGATTFLLTSLDDIAWLFNIRGNDVNNNPVVTSYALVTKEKAYIFIDKAKVSKEIEEELKNDFVEVLEYEEIQNYVKSFKEERVLFDGNRVNYWIFNSIPAGCRAIEEDNITSMMKAVKSKEEVENLKNCHVRDGVAMVKFMRWLKENIGREEITEISASDKLEGFRKQQKYFMGISFDTIAGHKDHAAMMHYKATPEITYKLDTKGFLLVDSGGQYLDGTTDITRTFVLGELTEEEKRDYTLVLKGNIALSRTKFLYGCTGTHLDAIARQPIWEYGIDYKCGTGHGVGYFLNVHEGPHRISPAFNSIKLEEGMIITNEPGIYIEGKHGIRTENELLVVKDESTEFGQFMKFESVTYCPIDLDGVVVDMLSKEEIAWLNSYHKMVFEKLSPYLDEEEKQWLANETREV
ncbi:aminopeptidase P family protein [Clostridium sp. KNHs214]|uniref:aminopeptidase P family protein n=1 Tax=Clostridium sp. KNHs214 TaxID=1540257 RepID=UPI00054D9AD8|nr:aminopeptidase P family protein [Clostridium sp. KNHs214]